MSTPTPAAPAGRYGPVPTAGARRRTWTLVALAAAAVLAVAVWVVVGLWQDRVLWKDLGYDVVDDGLTRVSFQVTKAPDATATCRVRALSESFTEVGYRTVTVGPSDVRSQRVTADVPTTSRAVTGSLVDCAPAEG
ncbi:DUF4307 domain-containing protein [Cellulomonas marina]|uniref:DUF4307 domain-containing protein n=1 Tax=Cellulomonas marina TaxID=988821 RepID=A0A1I0ZGR6_9CELL|nr:DUF4307 domain-containing protein [Cellulomonas marina]GIG28576.1 hypothetical protein Cma02nite_11760 [Cellulomonas marina]SFB24969.1 protein of unknown function [Cellulomonas marina]